MKLLSMWVGGPVDVVVLRIQGEIISVGEQILQVKIPGG